jgi:hypothetical protein
MLGPVLENIEQRSAGLARRFQLMRVIAVREDGSTRAKRTMNRVNHPNRKTLHASRECELIIGFDNQVKMVRLNREVHHAKVGLLARGDRAPHRVEQEPITAQAGKPLADALGHMHRMPCEMPLAPAVRHSRSDARRFASRPRPRTAVAFPFLERKLLLSGGSHHLIEQDSTKSV